MTTGIPHGPLSGADLPKLTGLSVLLVVLPPHIGLAGRNQPPLGAVIRAQPQSPFVQSVFLPDYEPDFGWHVSRFTYLGERPEPGSPVILAPEGGWSKNPVPGRMVRVEFRSGVNASGPSDDFDWSHETRRGKPLSQSLDIVAFSLIEAAKPEVKGEPSVSAAVEGDTASGLSSDRPAQALSDLAGVDGGLTPASEVFDLIAEEANDPIIAVLRRAGTPDAVLIEAAYAIIADRKDRAAPASPPAETGEGAPTCQACGGEIAGWLCQSCDKDFKENDAGHLVFVSDEDFAQPVSPSEGEAVDVMWRWTESGTDTDGDPKKFTGQYGDYTAVVLLSRLSRLWNVHVNKGRGKLGFKTPEDARSYATEVVTGLLALRLQAARETLSLYTHPASDQSDTERMRAAVVQATVDAMADGIESLDLTSSKRELVKAAFRACVRRMNERAALAEKEAGQ